MDWGADSANFFAFWMYAILTHEDPVVAGPAAVVGAPVVAADAVVPAAVVGDTVVVGISG